MTALAWETTTAIDFRAVWRTPIPSEYDVLDTGIYTARIEYIEPTSRSVRVTWRVLNGPDAGRRVRTTWLLTEKHMPTLAAKLNGAGIALRDIAAVGDMRRTLEGRIVEVMLVNDKGHNEDVRFEVLR
jgi:hypothetical protein